MVVDSDFDLAGELAKRGVGANRKVAEEFYSRPLGVDHAKAILDVWDANPEAWEPGALVTRLRNSNAELLPSEGWPPKSRKAQLVEKKAKPPDFEIWRAKFVKQFRAKNKSVPIPGDESIRHRYAKLFGGG